MKLRAPLCVLSLAVTAACGDNTNSLSSDEKEHGLMIAAEIGDAAQSISAQRALATRPVRIGHDGPDLDACAGFGQVKGLNPQGDNFLTVRSAPDVLARELDRLSEGDGVAMCDFEKGWIGVVYQGPNQEETDCGTGSPVASVEDYAGPCQSGWVSENFVELIAG